jgi:hypothetical protein
LIFFFSFYFFLRWEVLVCFVDIGEIVDHHQIFNFPLIVVFLSQVVSMMSNMIWSVRWLIALLILVELLTTTV